MTDVGLGKTLSVRMALTYSAIAIIVVSTLAAQSIADVGNMTTPITKVILDPKRRNELIDETFLEQKDMLLDMLEAKLKEVRDKNKKEDRTEIINETESKCELMPKNVDIVLKAHGISAIGDTDVRLKYGEDGNGTLSLDATGISNVGKVHVKLGVADGNVHIPGLDNVFTGEMLLRNGCNKTKKIEMDNTLKNSSPKPHQSEVSDLQTRRFDRGEEKLGIVSPLNETSKYVEKSENNDVHNINNINDYNNKSYSRIDNSTTLVPEGTSNATEVVNNTNTFVSNSAL